MATQILVCVSDHFIPEQGDHFDAVVAAVVAADIPAAAYQVSNSRLPELIEQAKRAVFEAEQSGYLSIVTPTEMLKLRTLLGLDPNDPGEQAEQAEQPQQPMQPE